jgi:hypothetical protein
MKFTVDVDNKCVILHENLSFSAIELIKRMIGSEFDNVHNWEIKSEEKPEPPTNRHGRTGSIWC